MTQATVAVFPTETRGLRRNTTGGPVDRVHNHGRPSADVLSRGDRTSPRAEQISLKAVRAQANGEALRVQAGGRTSPAEVLIAEGPSAAWIGAEAQHVI